MTEPGTDRVQIDSGLEQVAGAGVTDRVRCDPPSGERRHAGGTALDEPIGPGPRIGPHSDDSDHRFRQNDHRFRRIPITLEESGGP